MKSIMHQMLLGLRWRVPEGYRMPVQQAPISKQVDGLPVSWSASPEPRIHTLPDFNVTNTKVVTLRVTWPHPSSKIGG